MSVLVEAIEMVAELKNRIYELNIEAETIYSEMVYKRGKGDTNLKNKKGERK